MLLQERRGQTEPMRRQHAQVLVEREEGQQHAGVDEKQDSTM